MEEIAFDVIEQILVRLDVEDLIRCKSVCKSWQSIISCPPFVKAHLNRCYTNDRNNRQLGHRRICVSFAGRDEVDSFYCNRTHIVGSSNGLVCVSPRGAQFVVTNPSTRQQKKLPTTPAFHKVPMIRQIIKCWGFGYDLSADDYKVIVGLVRNRHKYGTLFYVFTLKSNTWKVIGQINYNGDLGRSGMLCGGALYWIMAHQNDDDENIIISLDLSTEEFTEIPLPLELLNKCGLFHKLGVIEECVCLFDSFCTPFTSKKWVLKNNKWELYDIDHHCERKYDVAHLLSRVDSQNTSYSLDDAIHVPSNGYYFWDTIFVNSLVSPHVITMDKGGIPRGEGNESVEVVPRVSDTRKMKRSCKHKRPRVRKLIRFIHRKCH